MKRFTGIFLLFLATQLAEARTWTDTQGKMIEAEVVWITADKSVKLRTSQGETDILPFSNFVAEDIKELEHLLLLQEIGGLHPVSWSEMNRLFGADIWQDEYLWDDQTAKVGERMRLKKESKTDFIENHRNYPMGKEKVLTEPVYTTVLYGGKEFVESLMFVFLNQGDIPCDEEFPSNEFIEEMTLKIEQSGRHVHAALVSVLGEPVKDSIGKGNMRQRVERWDWNGHAILLIFQDGKYTMLRVIPAKQADCGDKAEKIKSFALRERMASCVGRRENGDVIINNIPMIDQGLKGYCSPATWERYLRYLGMQADMYQLALIAGTGVGGGTYSENIIEATRDLLSTNGRQLEEIGSKPTLELISKYIDLGMPVMWHFVSEDWFQQEINRNTAQRNGSIYKDKPLSNNNSSSGHICLIIGYNKKTGEIAISDSWGQDYSERWVPGEKMKYISRFYSRLNVIKW